MIKKAIKNNLNLSFKHKIPKDLDILLKSNKNLFEKWAKLTPLAQNEWICWVTIVKNKETRIDHLKRLKEDLLQSKKRPCCWPGCPHRNLNNTKWFK